MDKEFKFKGVAMKYDLKKFGEMREGDLLKTQIRSGKVMSGGCAVCLFLCLALFLSGCSKEGEGIKTEAKYPTGAERDSSNDIYTKQEGIFGEDFPLFGGKKDKESRPDSGMEVNSFLWRASLDTVSFMPLASADPFGGVIITDWYQPPESPGERFKANVFILGRELRTNALKVKLYRQVKESGVWKDADVEPGAREKLEDTILTRARSLRVRKLG